MENKISTKCDCGKVLSLGGVMHKQEFKVVGSNKLVYLTYIKCNKCSSINVYQIDDKETKDFCATLQNIMKQTICLANSGKPIPKSLRESYKTLNKKLNKKRNDLNKKYEGVYVYQGCLQNMFKLNLKEF